MPIALLLKFKSAIALCPNQVYNYSASIPIDRSLSARTAAQSAIFLNTAVHQKKNLIQQRK
ncbi:hypothetical protein QT979_07665 [Microcoleus sp. w2-18bC1]|uniref:hypothetical protein n=1 Tax=unclassified Microcoleus TaxID=2642155 RepID=UPI002FD14D06